MFTINLGCIPNDNSECSNGSTVQRVDMLIFIYAAVCIILIPYNTLKCKWTVFLEQESIHYFIVNDVCNPKTFKTLDFTILLAVDRLPSAQINVGVTFPSPLSLGGV